MTETPDTITASFNQHFCHVLMFHLCLTFKHANTDKFKCLWCDGIAMPFLDSQLSIKSVRDTREIFTQAWIGFDGQAPYYMTIKFGKRALKHCMRGLSLLDCLPDEHSMDWITMDTEKMTIELRLE